MTHTTKRDLVVIHWMWPPGSKHAGATFWGTHELIEGKPAERSADGRLRMWQASLGLIPLAAARVTVTDGEDAVLLARIRAVAQPPERVTPSAETE